MRHTLLSLLIGFLLYLPFSKYNLWFFVFPALYLLFKNPKPYIWNLSGFVFFFLSLRCINIASVEFGGLNPLLAYGIFTLFVLFLTLYQFSVPLVLAKKLTLRKNSLFVPTLALSFVLFEVFRSYFPYGGFPWLIFGSVVSEIPLFKFSLHYLNVYGASAVLIFSIIFIERKKWVSVLLVTFTALLSLYAKSEIERSYTEAKTIKVALIQTAVDQHTKLNWERFKKETPKILEILEEAVKKKPDLVIMPESAFPFFFSEDEDSHKYRLMELSMQTPIIVGLIDIREGMKPFNSAYLINKGMVQHYDKIKLLPVGEYLPYPFGFLKEIFQSIGGIDYVAGSKPNPLETKGIKIATPICFEVAYYDLVKKLAKSSNIVAVLTNDGWFKDSDCTYQHLRWAKVRAIENGVYVLWVNNSGDTGVIDYKGNILAKLPYMKRDILFYDVPLRP